MPLFHVGGIVRNLFAPILSGGSSIVCTGFDPDAFWTYALELKATWCACYKFDYMLLSQLKMQSLKQVLRCSHRSSFYPQSETCCVESSI